MPEGYVPVEYNDFVNGSVLSNADRDELDRHVRLYGRLQDVVAPAVRAACQVEGHADEPRAQHLNPYLMLAAILGAMANGIEDRATPPAPITGNAYEQDLPQVPSTWDTAIAAFETAPEIARIFPAMLRNNLVMTKRQEAGLMATLSPDEQVEIYLDTV